MARTIKPGDLGAAIAQDLSTYSQKILARVNAAGEKAIKQLVKQTKATAPKKSGSFSKAITYTATPKLGGDVTYTWGVNAPKHRLTHLLVHGHQKRNGGRVPGDPFLENALETVLPEYEREVEEAIKNG